MHVQGFDFWRSLVSCGDRIDRACNMDVIVSPSDQQEINECESRLLKMR